MAGNGEELFLIKLVCKKLAQNKETSQIASELDVEEDIIERICRTAKIYAPEYEPEQIQYAVHNADS